MTKHIVTIIGAGQLGQAIAHVLRARHDTVVRLWDKDTSKVPDQGTIFDAMAETEAVFLCLPSWTFRDAAHEILPALPQHAVVVSMAKGLESDNARFTHELLAEVLPESQPWAIMSGPMLAAEIMEGKTAFGVIATKHPEASLPVASLFAETPVLTEVSGDVTGVAYMGVLKNVYSLGLGMVESLGWQGNARGWYVAMALRESAGVVTSMGGSAESAYGPAGLGDLIATGFSTHSRNRGHGQALIEGREYPQGSEGFASLPQLLLRIGNTLNDKPLLAAIAASVHAPAQAEAHFKKALTS